MNVGLLVALAATVSPVLTSWAAPAKTSGANSPAFGTVNGNATINYASGAPVPPKVNVVITPDTSKLNVLQRHQDALLIATNPTKVALTEAKFLRWAGDDEEYLTLTFRNTSKLPAQRFEFGVPDPGSAGKTTKSVQWMTFQPSASVARDVKFDYQIEPETEHVVPLVSVSDVRRLLRLPQQACIILASTNPNTVGDVDIPHKAGLLEIDGYNLSISYTWWSIFDQKFQANTSVVISVLTQRNMLLPPGPVRKNSDIRCREKME